MLPKVPLAYALSHFSPCLGSGSRWWSSSIFFPPAQRLPSVNGALSQHWPNGPSLPQRSCSLAEQWRAPLARGRFRRDRHRLLSAANRHWCWCLYDQGLARHKSTPTAAQLASAPFSAILLDACRLLAGGQSPLETAPSFAWPALCGCHTASGVSHTKPANHLWFGH